ncbi:MAG: cellulase family glycosylhydrolase [Desulfobacterales bacterium]|nr:cellulase family glycosylhydrolase [Desulfobacterales bacterium]
MNQQRWSAKRANDWYAGLPWLVGCNFIPSTAVNPIEMWQKETFDPATIDRELRWAADLGFNTVRVYLHDLVWRTGAGGLKERIDRFLSMATQRGIRTLLVLFDDCWHDNPAVGKQSAPVPGVHNSGWVQSPGRRAAVNTAYWPALEAYVTDILGAFGKDDRILMWDLYNEVGNIFLPTLSKPWTQKAFQLPWLILRHLLLPGATLPLLKKTFEWARSADPSQPLTSGVWFFDPPLNRYLLDTSDIITFHNYNDAANLSRQIEKLKETGRPLVCTEYMARPQGSRFDTHLPIFKKERVGCYNWGLVSGKTQTHFSWKSKPGAAEPAPWFHDILHPDGTPYDPTEADLIKTLTGANNQEQF